MQISPYKCNMKYSVLPITFPQEETTGMLEMVELSLELMLVMVSIAVIIKRLQIILPSHVVL